MSDIIWALDQRDRCIACPSTPVANAVVLHLDPNGELARSDVERWAAAGVMAASVAWCGADATSTFSQLPEDDRYDLEDALTGLRGLASVVAVVGGGEASSVAQQLAGKVGDCVYAGPADRDAVMGALRAAAPVAG